MGPRVMADPRHHGGFNQNLFGGLEHLDYFYIQLGMSSSKLTNSYFSEGLNLFSMIYGIILSIIFFNMIETNIFFINIIEKINNEAVSIPIETTSGLKKFNPWTLRAVAGLEGELPAFLRLRTLPESWN